MKQLIAYFIKYPVAVNILMLAIVLLGINGMLSTRSSLFPQVPDKLVVISIVYPGASPAEIEEGIVLKIEDNLRGLVGIDRVISVSSENAAVITIERQKDADIDILLADVKNAVDRVPSFPVDMEPPVVEKRLSRSRSIELILAGENLSLKSLKTVARQVEDEIRAINGLSQITVTGFPEEEIEIAVRENDLRAFNLTFTDVARAVASANILTTGGNIKTLEEEYLIRANNKSYYGDELDFIVVRANPNGQVIRLRDVATVRDKWSETPDRVYYNAKPGIQFSIGSTNSEDILEIAENVRNYSEEFNATRDNIQLEVVSDLSVVLRQRTALLIENGTIGILLVLVFLSLFLKPSIAFWVAVSLPVSFFGMFMFGVNVITINVLSLFGMIVVIGILVDDGIVIGENIYHHYEKGKNSIRAAIDGTMEVIPPIVSAILTTIVAFGTFYFIDGDVGAFFGEVASVVSIILLISLVEALIILPSHIAHSNALKEGGQNFLLNRWADKAMAWMRDNIYSPLLRFFLENKFFGLSIPIALMIITIGAMGSSLIKFTFFPPIASDLVQVELSLPQGTSETITDSIITRIEEEVWVVGEEFTEEQNNDMEVVQNVIRRIGPGTSNASLIVNLLPGENRDCSANEFANLLSEKMGPIPEAEKIVYNSGTTFGGPPISVSFSSNDITELKAATEELKSGMRQMPQLKDIADNDPEGIKEIQIKLKENAHLLGLTYNDVMSQVRSAFFGQPVQRFQRGRDEIRVWVRYDRKERSSIKNLDEQRIVTRTGQRIPFSEIASYTIQRGDVAINHLDGRREIQITSNLKNNKDSATELLGIIKSEIIADILARYPSISPSYEGQNREANKVGTSAMAVLPITFFIIYIIIAFTFRSYTQPILLFVMIPFSLIGVAWGHYIHGFPVNILSMLGIVALLGIVVNDGLVLIGKFNSFLKEGLPFSQALYEAGRSRFRAIFLTSITTVAGLAPLIFETSLQAQFLIPMAISIAYGITLATFLTLFMLPILLSISNEIKVGRVWLWTGKKPTREEVESAVKEIASEKEYEMG